MLYTVVCLLSTQRTTHWLGLCVPPALLLLPAPSPFQMFLLLPPAPAACSVQGHCAYVCVCVSPRVPRSCRTLTSAFSCARTHARTLARTNPSFSSVSSPHPEE